MKKTIMSNINKIIEEQKTYYDNNFGGYEFTFNASGKLREDIYSWHTQSIIKLLEVEIERKKGMKKPVCDCENEENNIYAYHTKDCDFTPYGYNQCLEEDIINLTNIKNNIK